MRGLLDGLTASKFTPQEIEWLKERRERIKLLLAHYGLEWRDKDTDWAGLAISLAMAHVPGMRISEKRGAPRKGDTMEAWLARRELLALVKSEQGNRSAISARQSIETICEKLAGNKSAQKKLPNFYRKRAKLSGPTLKRDYLKAKRETKFGALAKLLGNGDSPYRGIFNLGLTETHNEGEGLLSGETLSAKKRD